MIVASGSSVETGNGIDGGSVGITLGSKGVMAADGGMVDAFGMVGSTLGR